ncbi:MAG: carbohydrate kinase [Opitutus sp.]|nr:carbohydrate kinase [Opitutus sp.]
MPESAPSVICFGEMLWDILPEGLFPGGAPFNVAFHLRQFGLAPHVVTGVGRDLLGDELVLRLKNAGLDTLGVARHTGLPTGYVRATLSPAGDASYEIATEVAWDQIVTGEDTLRATVQARAVVFGSLALRSTFNRAALERLLPALPPDALRVFDVNLRAPHDDLALVRELARRATLLKMNATEARRLAGRKDTASGDEEELARAIAADTSCNLVCVTAAEQGAGLLEHGRWHWEPGQPVQVVDTVGSGDAFLAALLAQLLRGTPAPIALRFACRMGEWIARHRGATPAHDATTPR